MESNRGVSPVVGVILMVAITFILAAVIGAYVLGISGGSGGECDAIESVYVEPDGDVVVTFDREFSGTVAVSHDNGTEHTDVYQSPIAEIDANVPEGEDVDVKLFSGTAWYDC